MKRTVYDTIIIGGGAAGIGVGVALKDAGIDNFLVLEGRRIGASFNGWPAETRFLTPSFPTNSVGTLDLNSITIGTSPAFSLEVEHPTGNDYAFYLRQVARVFDLPVCEETIVLRVTKIADEFVIDTEEDTLRAKHVIWAAGEYGYPSLQGFDGSKYCLHTSMIDRYEQVEGDDLIVIGGFESGVDAACHLAKRGLKVSLFDRGCPWEAQTSDPSVALSTYSIERMREGSFMSHVDLHANTPIRSVSRTDEGYEVLTMDDRAHLTPVQPILATGFLGSHGLVMDLFESRDDGFPLLSECDESTTTPGLFLCGPSVRHGDHIFCFIFKFRMRFAVVAKAIATSLGLPATRLEEYRHWGMYLDDLSCCGEECIC